MNIKGVVKAHGTTLNSVAEKMGISKGRLSQIINGKPTVDSLRTIAEIVGCKVGDFFKAFHGVSFVGPVFEGAGVLREKETSAENQCDDCDNLFHFLLFFIGLLFFLI